MAKSDMKPARDPARAALADAIARLAEKLDARNAIGTAHDRAQTMVYAQYAELDVIEDDIKKARASQRDEIMVSVMRGDEHPGNSKLADAERRKAEVEARMAAAREATDILKTQLDEHDGFVALAERIVRERRDAVVFQALPAMLEAAAPLRREFESLTQVVRFIRQMSPGHMSADDPRRQLARDAEKISEPPLWSRDVRSMAAVLPWSEAAERLLTDPETLLPAAPLPFEGASAPRTHAA